MRATAALFVEVLKVAPMYTPFLMCGYAAALLLMLFGFRGIRRSTPDLHGSRQLSWFILCGLFGVLLIGLRPWTPALVSIVLANFLLFAGALCIYLAAADIFEADLHVFPWPGGTLIVALQAGESEVGFFPFDGGG